MNIGATNLRRAAATLALLTLPGAVHGCNSPIALTPPPGGGQQLALDYESYMRDVAPVLNAKGCDAGGDCHGGGIRGSLELSPASAKNQRFDFDQVSLQVSAYAPDASPILTEPLELAAGGTPHGVKAFASKSDSGWLAIHAWVIDGVQP